MSEALNRGLRPVDYEALDSSEHIVRDGANEEGPLEGSIEAVERAESTRQINIWRRLFSSHSGLTSVWTTILILCIAMSAGFFTMFQKQKQMELRLRDWDTHYKVDKSNNEQMVHLITDEVRQQKDDINAKYDVLDGQLQAVQNVINRLNNRTTNADVLDQLKVTYTQLKVDMSDMKSAVDKALKNTEANIDAQMKSNNDLLQKAQSKARGELKQTETHVQEILDKANAQVHQLQQNVSYQMGSMEGFLEDTVQRLNNDIRVAEDKIASEVNVVQKNVDQYVDITNKQFAQEDDFVRFQLAGTFTMLGSLISLYHLTSHLRHYYKPEVQRRIMAVLWMVPIYGLTSWLSLVATTYRDIWSFVRDSYEAYAIYTFVSMLVAIVEDGAGLTGLIDMLTSHVEQERKELDEAIANDIWPRPKVYLKPPFPCCYPDNRPVSIAKGWLFQCRLMALQFVLLKPLLGLVPLIFWLLNVEYEGHPVLKKDHSLDWTAPRLYELIATNTSVAFAFWGLLNLYHGMAKELAWCNPWPKFLCIKGVVFMTFWQGFGLQAMASLGYVGEKQANQLQNLLTCIEMLLASLAHFYIFPYYEWHEDYKREKERQVLIRDTLALRDFVTDMKMMTTKWGDDNEDRKSLSLLDRSRSDSYESLTRDDGSPFREVQSSEEIDEQAYWKEKEGIVKGGKQSMIAEAEMLSWRDNSGKGLSKGSQLGKALGQLEQNIEELQRVSPEKEDWRTVDSPPLSQSP